MIYHGTLIPNPGSFISHLSEPKTMQIQLSKAQMLAETNLTSVFGKNIDA